MEDAKRGSWTIFKPTSRNCIVDTQTTEDATMPFTIPVEYRGHVMEKTVAAPATPHHTCEPATS